MIDELKRIFNRFDTDKNAILGSQEMKKYAKIAFKEYNLSEEAKIPLKKYILAFTNTYDVNGNGSTDFPEFLSVFKKTVMKGIDGKSMFKVYDKDGNGSVSAAEMKLTVSNL